MVKLFICVIVVCPVLTVAASAVPLRMPGSNAAHVFDRLKKIAASPNYYWAWTYPWFEHTAENGDGRNAAKTADGRFSPKPISETVLFTPKDRGEASLEERFGIRPYFYYLDFYYLTGIQRSPDYYAVNRASTVAIVRKAWRDFGAVPVFSWHMENPCVTNGFKGASYRFKCAEHKNLVRAILTDERGPSFAPRDWFMSRLEEIVTFLRSLTDEHDEKIPVILRYAHEMDGGWFWWGRENCSNTDYIALARMEADFLRTHGGKEQILFAYTPDRWWWGLGNPGEGDCKFLTWYPGDEYVDILGYDDYAIGSGKTPAEREQNFTNAVVKLRILSDYATSHGKAVILSESGAPNSGFFYEDLNRLMSADGVRVAFANTWIGPWTWPQTADGLRDLENFVTNVTVCVKKHELKKGQDE